MEVDDSWDERLDFYDFNKALDEYEWLSEYSDIREFILIRRKPALNDEMPF